MSTCTLAVVDHNTAGSPRTTGAFTPAAGDLLLCVWAGTGISDGFEGTATCTSTGETASWDQVDFVDFTTAGNQGKMFCFIQTALCAGVSTTVTVGDSGDEASGNHVWIYRVSGMTLVGTAAKRQKCEDNEHAVGLPAASPFGGACLTTNPVLSFIHDEDTVGNAPQTAPVGWTLPTSPASEGYILTPTSRGVSAFINSGFTGTAVTWQVTGTGVYGHYGIELDATGTPETAPLSPLFHTITGG